MAAQLALCALLALPAGQTPTAPWLLEYGLTGDQLKARTRALRDAGYQPTCVSGYNRGEDSRYAVVWEKGKGPEWVLDYGLTPAQLDKRAAELKKGGFRPACLSGFDLVDAQGFIDLWRKADGPAWDVQYGQDGDGMEKVAAAMKKAGFRPVTVSTYVSGSVSRFATVWEKSDVAWELKWGLKQAALDTTLTEMGNDGYRPVAIAGLGVEEDVRYAVALAKRKGPEWAARYNLTADDLKSLAVTMGEKKFKPVWLSGYNTLRGQRYATIWEKVTK
jgi:hypothetical protein